MGTAKGMWCECRSWAHWGNSRTRQSSVLLFFLYVLKDPSLTFCCCLCPLRGARSGCSLVVSLLPWKSTIHDSQGEIEGRDGTLSCPFLRPKSALKTQFSHDLLLFSVSGRSNFCIASAFCVVCLRGKKWVLCMHCFQTLQHDR